MFAALCRFERSPIASHHQTARTYISQLRRFDCTFLSTTCLDFVRAAAACGIANVRGDSGGGSSGFSCGLATKTLSFAALSGSSKIYICASVEITFS
jgi:hypothetical protein